MLKNTKSRMEEKRKNAEARQEAYNKLSFEQKLARSGAKVKVKLLKSQK